MERHRPSRLGLLVWWLGIAAVAGLIAAAFLDIAYSRLIYVVVVMPIGGVLLFPAAYAANRWLTPVISLWLGRS